MGDEEHHDEQKDRKADLRIKWFEERILTSYCPCPARG
jgi:hypothetical protein